MPDSPNDPAAHRYDVCVVGAGPAGATTAFLLARQGLDVALVDRARFPRDKTCGDGITPRGLRVLKRIGVLDQVRAAGRSSAGVDIRGQGAAGDIVEFTIRFDADRGDEPSDLIVVPRLALDDLLLAHARSAGPTYVDQTKVVDVQSLPDGARVIADDGRTIDARVVVLATGAESQLLRTTGLLARKPALEHAARAYFENVDGLTDRIVLFFDGVDLPGYGWIFPTGPRSANIGCGVFAQGGHEHGATHEEQTPQAQRLKQLIATHPMLVRMLKNATRSGPIRAYPLRTDFHPEFAGSGRLLVVGEAAGLVNPITGEGIDYALESAEFLAASFAARWRPAGAARIVDDAAASALREDYRARLDRRFTTRFKLYRAIQKHAMAPERFPALVTQVSGAPRLQRLVVDGLFGRMRPAHLLKPGTLWEMARTMLKRTPARQDVVAGVARS